MTRYLVSFDAHAMDHIPEEDMPAVSETSHAVVQDAADAGVWVFGAGMEGQKASIVSADGTVTEGSFPDAIGGFSILEVASYDEAVAWAARIAVSCRLANIEVRQLMPDSEQDEMLRRG